MEKHQHLNILINNAGVFKTPNVTTNEGLDIRFVVNTIAPYYLTQKLLPLMEPEGRVINLSSAAQSAVDLEALLGQNQLSDFEVYAQSKLAITMWFSHLASKLGESGSVIIAVNPSSLLGTKMVKEGFDTAGKDINIGVGILTRLSLDDEFKDASGKYFDNDSDQFSSPHPDGLNEHKSLKLVSTINQILSTKFG